MKDLAETKASFLPLGTAGMQLLRGNRRDLQVCHALCCSGVRWYDVMWHALLPSAKRAQYQTRSVRREPGRLWPGYRGRNRQNLVLFSSESCRRRQIDPATRGPLGLLQLLARLKHTSCQPMYEGPTTLLFVFFMLTNAAQRAAECDRSVSLPARQRDTSHAR